MYDSLRKGIARHISLSPSVWEDVCARWHPVHFSKDSFITEANQSEHYFYFILSGVQRLYYLTPAGQEVTLGFTFEGDFSGVYDAFLQQVPARCFLQNLTDTEALCINFVDMDELFATHRSMERWGRLFAQDILFGRVQREVELISRTAEERYRDFLRRSPAPLQQIPQKYLASYLNMTPETFSRLRQRRIS